MVQPTSDEKWARQLRPLVLGAEPIEAQLRRRLGITAVGSGLMVGLMLFFLGIFAGFGRWGYGLGIAAGIGLLITRIWWQYGRLQRVVAWYQRDLPASRDQGMIAGRIDLHP